MGWLFGKRNSNDGLIPCRKCGKRVSPNATVCVHCNKSLKPDPICKICGEGIKSNPIFVEPVENRRYPYHDSCLTQIKAEGLKADTRCKMCGYKRSIQLEYGNDPTYQIGKGYGGCEKCGEPPSDDLRHDWCGVCMLHLIRGVATEIPVISSNGEQYTSFAHHLCRSKNLYVKGS